MMDALKQALKQVMSKHGNKQGNDDIDLKMITLDEGKPEGEMSEHAPELGAGDEAHVAMTPESAHPADDGEQALHQKILEALLGKGSSFGRKPNSLSERAKAHHMDMKKKV